MIGIDFACLFFTIFYLMQSMPLWNDYINFVQENDPSVRECSPDGITKARNLFERAVTAAGLHVAEGNKIWEAYREFEQAILLTIDAGDTKVRNVASHKPYFISFSS